MTGKSEPLISNHAGIDAATPSQNLDAVWRRFGDQLRRRARTRLRQYGLTGQAESMDICNDVMADLARRDGGKAVTPDDVLAYILRPSTIKCSIRFVRWPDSVVTFVAPK